MAMQSKWDWIHSRKGRSVRTRRVDWEWYAFAYEHTRERHVAVGIGDSRDEAEAKLIEELNRLEEER